MTSGEFCVTPPDRFRRFVGLAADIASYTGAVWMRYTLVIHLGIVLGGLSAMAANPSLFFTKNDVPALRETLSKPGIAPAWQTLRRDAGAFCDPESSRYADPDAPFEFRARGERVSDGRYNALLVHQIGRALTERMQAIGFTCQMTGNAAMGDHGAAFLAAALREYPVSHEQVRKGFAGGRGDIMRGLAFGYDWLSERLSPGDRRAVAEACADYIEFFLAEFEDPRQWFYKVHNYNGVNGGAAGCLILALRDEFPDRYAAWLAGTVGIIERWLDAGFDEQGAYLEGVGYSGYGLGNTVLFAHALRRAGGKDLLAHPVFARLAEYYALSKLPGAPVYDARNDSSYTGLGGYVLGLSEAPNGRLYRWLWEESGRKSDIERILLDNDVKPLGPSESGVPTAQHFQGRGLCIWRTGWTSDDIMFSVEAGPYYPVTHNQGDKGHFTLYGLGQRWATDPGYANEHSPNGRGQTPAHSCVLIDGVGQALSGAGWGTDGRIVAYSNTERLGYALADCTDAYNRNNTGKKGAVVQHALRHCLFIYPRESVPAYAVVLDDIVKDGSAHEYVWQMMIDERMTVTLRKDRALLTPPSASGGAYVATPWTDPEDSNRSVEPGAASQGEVEQTFRVADPGEYTLWARVRTLGEIPAKSDSFFVQMDGGREIAWHMPGKRSWTWGRVASGVPAEPVTFRLEAGEHTLTVRRREPGAQMDCLWLTLDADADAANEDVRKAGVFLEAESGTTVAPMAVHQADAVPLLSVHVNARDPLELATDEFVPDDYHTPRPFPRLRAVTRSVDPQFMALLLPLPAGVAQPSVSFSRTDDERSIRIDWGGTEDRIVWPRDGRAPSVR
jgi:hypothetical protein